MKYASRYLAVVGTVFAVAACGAQPDTTPEDGQIAVQADGGDAAVSDAATSSDASSSATRLRVHIENIAPWTMLASGAVTTKTNGATGPIGPGESFEMTFDAGHGQRLSFAAMLGESNDWFFAPGADGLALYAADGTPMQGDVTSQISLWDAGTEVDQEPGVGADTGPRQTTPDQGAPDADRTVRAIGAHVMLANGSMFALPATTRMIRATLTPRGDRSFTLRIDNVSTSSTLSTSTGARAIHVSPVVWSLHTGSDPLFVAGMPDRGQGLEQLAEAGHTSPLSIAVGELTGPATPVSPGVFVVHRTGEPIYTLGAADRHQGLERIAESGDAALLAMSLRTTPPQDTSASGAFDTPVGASMPGAATPGHAFEFEISARPGDRLSFATMFGMSDDWFFATPPNGIALFDASGAVLAGDVSASLGLYDAGTEIDELLSIGPDVGPQQAMPDQGPSDPIDQVRVVSATDYPRSPNAHLRVTIALATE